MIEVFKTNVTRPEQASMLVAHIERSFAGHEANFDLHDCDNILRVRSVTGKIEPFVLIDLLKECGFVAEILPD